VFGIGIAVGPSGGGLLLEYFDWGSVFLVNVPIVLAALLIGWRLIPESKDAKAPKSDPLGAVLSTAGLVTLVYGVIEAPAAGWASATTLGAFGIAAALLAAFVAWELRSDHPMLDVRLFRNTRFSAASAALGLASFSLLGSIFVLTQHLQGVLGYSPLEAGLRLLPVAVGMMIAAPRSAKLAERIGTRATIALGMTLVSVGLALMAFADAGNGYPIVAAAMFTLALGMGLAMAPATDSVMSVLPVEKAGVGSAMNDTVRLVGGALGVAVLGSVLSSGYRGGMDGAPEAAQESLGHALSTGDPGLANTAIDAFVGGMHSSSIVAAAVALVGAVVAFTFLPRREARREAKIAAEVVAA
jgi:EmrB/QacA subfamily drug resistance transporter